VEAKRGWRRWGSRDEAWGAREVWRAGPHGEAQAWEAGAGHGGSRGGGGVAGHGGSVGRGSRWRGGSVGRVQVIDLPVHHPR
jgi:hypothetical protein